jgi:hypothetical protein
VIIVGLLLLIAAVIFGAEFASANHHHFTNPVVFGQTLGLSNDAAIFIVGAITGGNFLIGLALIGWGMRRKAAKAVTHHRERKVAKGARSERDHLAEKNEELTRNLSLQHSEKRAGRRGVPEQISNLLIGEGGATRVNGVDAID